METLLDQKDLLKYIEEPLKFKLIDPEDTALLKSQSKAWNAQEKKRKIKSVNESSFKNSRSPSGVHKRKMHLNSTEVFERLRC